LKKMTVSNKNEILRKRTSPGKKKSGLTRDLSKKRKSTAYGRRLGQKKVRINIFKNRD